jgi:predicted enzyme related to lactoylglutathione lyase
MQMLRKAPLCLFVGLILSGAQAALAGVALAPPAPRPTVPAGVAWFDLDVHDLDAAQGFYGSLFGWTFAPGDVPGQDFVLIKAGDAEIGTLDRATGAGAGGGLSIYFPVDDAAATYERALALGARSVFAPMPVPDASGRTIAMVLDLDGHAIGFVAAPTAAAPRPRLSPAAR